MKELDVDLVRSLLSYDPETGLLMWKTRDQSFFPTYQAWSCWNGKNAGEEAFRYVGPRGYKQGAIFKSNFYHHRVSWAIYHGAWPNGEIDHINGDRKDNRIANLREATRAQNMQNTRAIKTKSGAYGVYWIEKVGRWRAMIQVGGKKINLGYYADLEEAKKVRREAQERLGFHPNHGSTELASSAALEATEAA